MSKQRSKYWGVVRTKQASSRDAVANISRQGFEYYRGLYRERPTVRGNRPIKPLFPYYLLVRINLRIDDWKALASTRGVTRLFMSDDRPSRVPDEAVEYIRSCENELGYYADPAQEPPRFNRDERVTGSRGLFADCSGIYQGLAGSSAARVRVLFSILGKPHVFEVSAYDLMVDMAAA